jgi:hypothetical protein
MYVQEQCSEIRPSTDSPPVQHVAVDQCCFRRTALVSLLDNDVPRWRALSNEIIKLQPEYNDCVGNKRYRIVIR